MAVMAERRTLTSDELQDALRLDALLRRAKEADRSYTRDFIGQKLGWSSSGAVSQYAKGHIPLNVKAAAQLYIILREVLPGLTMDDLSPRFAKLIKPTSSQDPFSGAVGVMAAYEYLSDEKKKMVEEHIKSLYFRQKAEEEGITIKGLLDT